MGITVQYAPDLRLLGRVANQGGFGNYLQNLAQFNQRERLSLFQIADAQYRQQQALRQQALLQQQQLAARQMEQARDQAFRAGIGQRQMLFDAYKQQQAQQALFQRDRFQQENLNRRFDSSQDLQRELLQLRGDQQQDLMSLRGEQELEQMRARYDALGRLQQDSLYQRAQLGEASADFKDARRFYQDNFQKIDPQSRQQLRGLLNQRQQILAQNNLLPEERQQALQTWNKKFWDTAQSATRQPTEAEQLQQKIASVAQAQGISPEEFRQKYPNAIFKLNRYGELDILHYEDKQAKFQEEQKVEALRRYTDLLKVQTAEGTPMFSPEQAAKIVQGQFPDFKVPSGPAPQAPQQPVGQIDPQDQQLIRQAATKALENPAEYRMLLQNSPPEVAQQIQQRVREYIDRQRKVAIQTFAQQPLPSGAKGPYNPEIHAGIVVLNKLAPGIRKQAAAAKNGRERAALNQVADSMELLRDLYLKNGQIEFQKWKVADRIKASAAMARVAPILWKVLPPPPEVVEQWVAGQKPGPM